MIMLKQEPEITEYFLRHLSFGKYIESVSLMNNRIDIHYKRGTHLVMDDEDTRKMFEMGWYVSWFTNNNDHQTRLKRMQVVLMLKRNVDVKI